ncbi:MAG: iron ABC transporter [Dehalococcoidia bacterium]|nr:iron ABC transporter [Dehalococcoidia bacterium]
MVYDTYTNQKLTYNNKNRMNYIRIVRRIVLGLIAIFVIGTVASSVGAVNIPLTDTIAIAINKFIGIRVKSDWPEVSESILINLRFPRIILSGLVGASLSISGAAYQGLFRNPLADPYLIGAASGAGLGAAIVFLTGLPLLVFGGGLLPIAAFVGSITAVTLAYFIGRRRGQVGISTLILAGVAISSLAGAITSLLMIKSDPNLRPLLSWLLGGFSGSRWMDVFVLLPYVVPPMIVLVVYSRMLNILQLNDLHAQTLGVNVNRTKTIILVSASLITASAVAFSGVIGFVGLVGPHVVRLIWGSDYRHLVPMSAILGAGFLIVADLGARVIAIPTELPVGIITAFFGAPFFIYILKTNKRSQGN